MFKLGREGCEIIFQYEVDDALIGAIAIFQRHFFRENLDLPNGFGRQITQFAKARNTLTIEQYDWHAAATATARIGLRCNRRDQIGQRRCA